MREYFNFAAFPRKCELMEIAPMIYLKILLLNLKKQLSSKYLPAYSES